MAKRLGAIALFFLLLAAASAGLLGLNGLTPVLSDGSALPADLGARQYALTGVQWDEARQGYHLTLPGTVQEDLTLTVADLDQVSIFFWGEPLAGWGEQDLYQRVESVFLPAAAINAKGGIDLLFQSDSWGSQAQELLSRQTMTLAKLLLGGAQKSSSTTALVFGFVMFSAGLYALLIASNLVLYRRKPSEKYLLLLSCVAAVSLIATLLMANLSIIPVRRSVFYMIRPLISICPVILHAAIGLSLFDDCAPRWIQKFLTLRALLLLTLGVVLARFLSSYSIYTAVRWALMIPVVWTLSNACVRGRPGARPMLAGYALSESVVVLLFLINNFQAAASGGFLTHLHMNQMSYLFVLLPSMFVINRRFADKFQESERLSQELAALNASLDAQVEERTRQLREVQEKKHNMMTNIFHDIRSPIFILQGNLDQLHPPAEEEPLRTAMQGRLAFLKRLTEDLFLVSKLEEDVVLYEEDRVDLGELLAALETPNQAEAERLHITLSFDCERGLWVWGDRPRLQQAFQNLIDNAFHYTHAGGVITVRAFREGDMAAAAVRDNGAGIEEKDLPMIFERYFKSSRADIPRSSGLGLYIAREITEHHRGTIAAESAPGAGSCFTVRLPLLPEEE